MGTKGQAGSKLMLSILIFALYGCAGPQQQPPLATASSQTTETFGDTETSTQEIPESDASPSATAQEPSCELIGFQKVPRMPSKLARKLNADALKAHRLGEYETALAGFRAALAESPDYDVVRFNVTCAMIKLGRVEEARSELETLLLQDLPNYAPRIETDADLEPLRDDGRLRSFIDRVAACYNDMIGSGTPLVAFRNETSRAWSQAVLYHHTSGRLVPVSPRVSMHRSGLPPHFSMIAPIFDAETQRTLVLSYVGGDAEDPHLDEVKVRVFRAPLGELLLERRGPSPEDAPYLRASLQPEGALLKGRDGHGRDVSWLIDTKGMRLVKRAMPDRHINAGETFWSVSRSNTRGYQIQGNRLLTSHGTHELGRGHAANDSHWVTANEEAGVAIVYSSSSGDCGYPDRFIVDVVNLRDGSVSRRLSGQGQIVLDLGADGALYIQTRTELRRYPDPLDEAYDVLPDGLGLSANPWGFNPYC